MYTVMPNVRDSITEPEREAHRYRNWPEYQDSDDEDEDFDLQDAFKDLIQRDPTVCDNCFSMKYTRISHQWWRGSFGWLDYERWLPLPGAVTDVPADETAQGTKLACSECGHRTGKSRPIPKADIVGCAKNISETLDAKEVEHDYRVLIHEVERRNTSENQGKQDSHVFGPAVEKALRY